MTLLTKIYQGNVELSHILLSFDFSEISQIKNFEYLLGVFAKLRKATIRFVMPVVLSVRPHGTTLSPLDRVSCNLL